MPRSIRRPSAHHGRGAVRRRLVRVEVCGRGPGIPTADASACSSRSSGVPRVPRQWLGLAIARGFVEAHAGRIWAEDAPGGGACIVFTLPLEVSDAVMTRAPASVLVVDDEPQIRRALRVALRANGYAVQEAGSGGEALDHLAERPPDLVILDLVLPDIDGVEVCRRLREWSRVPVIVLSAHHEDETKVRALDEGANDYVTKPFSMPELLARMRVALRVGANAASE